MSDGQAGEGKPKTYIVGPLLKPMTVEQFLLIERKQELADQLAEDAERLRRLLDDDGSSTVS